MNTSKRFYIIQNWNIVEQISYAMLWLILIILPLIFWDYNDNFQQKRIVNGWFRIAPFLIIFLIHNWILLPKLLLNKQYTAYLVSLLVLILLVNYWFVIGDKIQLILQNWLAKEIPDTEPNFRPPRRGAMPPPHRPGMGHMRGHEGHALMRRHGTSPYLHYTYNLIISLLMIGVNTSLRFTTQWLQQEQKHKEKEKENLQSQLVALRNQVSPHFFMNTLNNIHALIDYDKDNAKESVLQLSKMMRYLLYESETGKAAIQREVDFLKSYIDLMRLRLQPEVDLKTLFPDNLPDGETYTLIGLSIIENSFKHGINPRGNSFIHILFEIHNGKIHINCRNSKHLTKQSKNEPGGIGLTNTRQRLNLLFGTNYSLNIYDRDSEFEVDLIYPLL